MAEKLYRRKFEKIFSYHNIRIMMMLRQIFFHQDSYILDADYYNDEKEKNDMLDQEIFSITLP